jgi:putative ATP-binding cassette transporter
VPQLPYVPLGDLRAVVSYPAEPGEIDDDRLRDVLSKVSLGHLGARLDEEADWAKVLSPGEQQRVAFARVVLTKPKAVFLDEATSAVDEGLEFALYQLLRTELPDCIVVSISHRSTVEQHHDQLLELIGEGQWRLGRVGRVDETPAFEPAFVQEPAYVQEPRAFKSPRSFESPHSSNGLAVARAHDPSRVR